MARKQAQNTQSVTQGSVTLKVYEVNRGNRTLYSVAHKEGGRRQLKQFGDIGTALTWAANRAKEIDRGKAPAFMLSPDEGAMYQRARQILAGTGKSLDEIAREYVDARDNHPDPGAHHLDRRHERKSQQRGPQHRGAQLRTCD